jgi:hypothetical protein
MFSFSVLKKVTFFWKDQEVIFGWEADLTRIGNRAKFIKLLQYLLKYLSHLLGGHRGRPSSLYIDDDDKV